MKKIMKWIMLFGLAVLLLIPGIASANLLVNPGFELTGEQGHMTGWTGVWNEPNIYGAQNNPFSGLWHARNAWDGGRYQDVAITGGETYRLIGWAYIPSGFGESPWGTCISLRFLNSGGGTVGYYQIDMQGLERDQYNMADTGWVTSPITAVTAQVRFDTWSSDPWYPVHPTDFDSFDLSPIPEPMSFLLFGTGLIGLACLAKRVGKHA